MSWSMRTALDEAFDTAAEDSGTDDPRIIAALILGDAIAYAAVTVRCGLSYSTTQGMSVAEAIEVAARRIADTAVDGHIDVG